jgi:WD40 repeat protein
METGMSRKNLWLSKKVMLCMSLTLFWYGTYQVLGWQEKSTGRGINASSSLAHLVTQIGHSEFVLDVAYSPDGRYVATGSIDRTICLWDALTGKEIRRFVGHTSQLNDVDFSPDGRYLLSTSVNEDQVRLWDVNTGEQIRRFLGDAIFSVAFSSDGRFIVGGTWFSPGIIWDANTGRVVRRFTHYKRGGIRDVEVSNDGRYVITADFWGKTATLWDFSTGEEIRSFVGHADTVNEVAFSPDGRFVATGGGWELPGKDYSVRIWETDTGREVQRLTGHTDNLDDIRFSPNGLYLLTGTRPLLDGEPSSENPTAKPDKTARLWEVATGKEVWRFEAPSNFVSSVEFSPDGRSVLIGNDNVATLLESSTGKKIRDFSGSGEVVEAVAFPKGEGVLVMGHRSGTTRLWNIRTNEVKSFTLPKQDADGNSLALDGRHLLTIKINPRDLTLRLWDIIAERELQHFENFSKTFQAWAISSDGRYFATVGSDDPLILWNVKDGKELRRLASIPKAIRNIEFSPDGHLLIAGLEDGTAQLWDVNTGLEKHHFTGHKQAVEAVTFSPDGRFVLTGSRNSHVSTIRLWDTATGKMVRQFEDPSIDEDIVLVLQFNWNLSLALSPDNRYLAAASWGYTIRVWDVSTGKEAHRLIGHSGGGRSVIFSPDSRFILSGSEDTTTRLWNISTGREVCRLISFLDGTWAVVDGEGRFDASNGGDVEGLHWIVDNEPISLNQLKERYYEPGLFAKIMGFKKEPLRPVSAFKEVKLFPQVEYAAPAPNTTVINIKLTNRGGGIGKVRVLLGDKEVVDDAREPRANPQADSLTLTVVFDKDRINPGEENNIKVIAWNAEGYLSSRAVERTWIPEGTPQSKSPEVYAIVGGISQYSSPGLNLRFAAKDAEDMAKALELGAKRLFGDGRVHLTLLSTGTNPRTIPPTKVNFEKAFEQAKKAKPWDILIVYLAGHGVVLEGGKDIYCYLTQESRSKEPASLSDPLVRSQTTIASDELVEWIKKVPALKQVMILDTCAAGAAAFKLIEPRDIPSDQIRSIERLKDRTGFHVLMGSASDADSYEASQYGQGLLTFALLQGMRGAALREEEYVDVSKLFQYAADYVPQLAHDIGGIQRPQIAAPQGTSFDVGMLTKEDKEGIPLATVKPLILRPRLINPAEGDDTLDLIKALRQRLREASYVPAHEDAMLPSIVYIDEEELPGAIRPTGTYTVKGDEVMIKLYFRRDGQTLTSLRVEGSKNNISNLVDKIMEAIIEVVQKL